MKPHSLNEYRLNASKVWELKDFTFFLIDGTGSDLGYRVRVFPHAEEESFWLFHEELYETVSGASYNILAFLENENYEN
jgi:hypothetical protein